MDPKDNALAEKVWQWIVGVLGDELEASESNSKVTNTNELQAKLKNGNFLCQVVNKIQPGGVPKIRINTSPAAFKQMGMVESFIQSCDYLGIPKENLFDVIDLYNNQNMKLVLKVIMAFIEKVELLGLIGPNVFSHEQRNASDQSAERSEEAARARQWILSVIGDQESMRAWLFQSEKEKTDTDKLHVELKDGIILCRLMNLLLPDSIKDYKTGFCMEFDEKNNIQTFLDKIRSRMNFAYDDLFEVRDLRAKADMNKVVRVILALSQKTSKDYENLQCGRARKWIQMRFQHDMETEESKKARSMSEKLHLELKSGVELCQKFNQLEPDSIKICTDPEKNIEMFLAECRRIGMPSDQLFSAVQLMTGSNMTKVANCILAFDRAYGKFFKDQVDKKMMGDNNSGDPCAFSPKQPKEEKDYDSELGEKARQWIMKFIGEDISNPKSLSLSGKNRLHEELKDGYVLCQVVDRISPGSGSKAVLTGLGWKQINNIKMFLNACSSLGMSEEDLFQPSDLMDNKNMASVIKGIAKLSVKAESMGFHYAPAFGKE